MSRVRTLTKRHPYICIWRRAASDVSYNAAITSSGATCILRSETNMQGVRLGDGRAVCSSAAISICHCDGIGERRQTGYTRSSLPAAIPGISIVRRTSRHAHTDTAIIHAKAGDIYMR